MTSVETGLKIFEKPEFGSVRVVDKDGDPWFVARDVCEALGFDEYNTNNATKGLDDDEKSTILKVLGRNDSNGLRKDAILINEPGLYALVLRSNKPEAKIFKRWITHEVIPTIRKTGGYGNGILMPNFTDPLAAAEAWIVTERARIAEQQRADYYQRTKAEIGNRREATAMATASAATRKVGVLEDKLGLGRNYKQVKAIPWLFDEFADCPSMYQQVGKRLSALSQRLGYKTERIPCPEFPNGIKAYHVDVIDAFRNELKRDLNMLGKWRLRRAA